MPVTDREAQMVKSIIDDIRKGAEDVLHRSERFATAADMSDTQYKALAKEVEEVGEQVNKLEKANPCIVPALFEVPHGRWTGWSGLVNYRNMLAHEFRHVTPDKLLERVKEKLALSQVTDLLVTVRSVAMMSKPFDFGSASDIRRLPQTAAHRDLLPGSSLIVIRIDEAGELMVVRSWRDEKDNWRASTRWVQIRSEDDDFVCLGFRDTELVLIPRSADQWDLDVETGEPDGTYNLLSIPPSPYAWFPRILEQTDSSLTRKKRS